MRRGYGGPGRFCVYPEGLEHAARVLDERRRRRRAIPFPVPGEREERNERASGAGADHSLNDPVVIRAEHESRLDAVLAQVRLDVRDGPALAEADEIDTGELRGPQR